MVLFGTLEENKEKGGVGPDRLAKSVAASPPLGRYLISLTSGTEEVGVLAHPRMTLTLVTLLGSLDFQDEFPEQFHHCGWHKQAFL